MLPIETGCWVPGSIKGRCLLNKFNQLQKCQFENPLFLTDLSWTFLSLIHHHGFWYQTFWWILNLLFPLVEVRDAPDLSNCTLNSLMRMSLKILEFSKSKAKLIFSHHSTDLKPTSVFFCILGNILYSLSNYQFAWAQNFVIYP